MVTETYTFSLVDNFSNLVRELRNGDSSVWTRLQLAFILLK
jgi:hypothetical protein